jgi:hypothetical protein
MRQLLKTYKHFDQENLEVISSVPHPPGSFKETGSKIDPRILALTTSVQTLLLIPGE